MRHKAGLFVIGLALLAAGCHRQGVVNPVPPPSDPKLPQETKAEKAQNAAAVHTSLAQHYIDIGNTQGALEKITIAVKDDPTYVPAQTVMAYIYQRINDMPNAEIHYRRAVELKPADGSVNNNLGQFLCGIGKGQEALPFFAKAIADPFYQTPDMAFTNQGVCQLKLNDSAGAEVSFRHALQHNANNAYALLELATVLYQKNDLFNASAFLQRFDSLARPTADSLKLGYEIESRLGNTEAAQNYSKRLLSQFPDSEQAQALNQNARP